MKDNNSVVITPKQVQKLREEPHVKAFLESEDCQKTVRLISMAYLVHSVANSLVEDAFDILAKYDSVRGKIKTTSNNVVQSFDTFDKVMRSLIGDQEAKWQFCDDFDEFEAVCIEYMNKGEGGGKI